MPLSLTSFSFNSKSGFLSPNTANPLIGSIGDFIELTLNYTLTSGDLIGDFWFNPGLFVDSNQLLVSANAVPESGYFIEIPDQATFGPAAMNPRFSGAVPPATKNWSATFQKLTNQNFIIKFDFYITSDLNNWLGQGSGINNIDRFLKTSSWENNQLTNSVDSVYSGTGKNIGCFVALFREGSETIDFSLSPPSKAGSGGIFITEYTAPSGWFAIVAAAYSIEDKFEIIRGNTPGSPVVASSGTTAGNNAGAVNGFDGGGYALGAQPVPSVPIPNYWYISSLPPSRLPEYIAATGDPTFSSLAIGNQIIWCATTPGEIITVRVAGTGATRWDYWPHVPPLVTNTRFGPVNLHSYLPAEFSFVNADVTNQLFNLSRSGRPQTQLSTASATDVEVLIDYTGTFSQIRYALLDVTQNNQITDFLNNYKTTFATAPVPTGGPTFETNISIPTTAVQVGRFYRIICIGYDAGDVLSKTWISPVLTVTDVDFCEPTITSEFNNYVQNFITDYLQLSTLQRLLCKLEIAEGCTDVTIITAVIESERFVLTRSGSTWTSNDSRFSAVGTGTINTELLLQIPDSWAGRDILITYSLQIGSEIGTTYQRLNVRANEEDAGGLVLSNTEIFDSLGAPIEDFCSLPAGEFVTLRTTKADPNGFRQIAVHTDGSAISENDPFSGILPTATDSGFQNIDINFSGAIAEYEFSPAVYGSGKIGVVVFKDQQEAEISVSFRKDALSPDFTVSGPLSNVGFKFAIPNTLTSADFNFKINGGTVLTFAQFQSQASSLVNLDIVTAICTNLAGIDTSLVLTYSAVGDTGTSAPPILLSPISPDALISLNRKVTINSVSAAGGQTIYGAVRLSGPSSSDWSIFTLSDAPGIAAMQAIIDGLVDGDLYRLHFIAIFTTSATTILTVNFTDQ